MEFEHRYKKVDWRRARVGFDSEFQHNMELLKFLLNIKCCGKLFRSLIKSGVI
jgi:hypothetical protein